MTELKHTPGPWVQATRGPNGCPIIGTENGLMVAMLAHSSNENTQRQEAEANACMIAAAPELLEALQGALKAWDAVYPSMKFDGDVETLEDFEFREFQKARAAIAKATGVQP